MVPKVSPSEKNFKIMLESEDGEVKNIVAGQFAEYQNADGFIADRHNAD